MKTKKSNTFKLLILKHQVSKKLENLSIDELSVLQYCCNERLNKLKNEK